MKHLLLLALLPFLARAALAAERAAQKPNIFMMIVDDFGFANFGPHRTPSDDPTGEVQTPAMDALAREGLLLDRKCVSRGGMLRSALARILARLCVPPPTPPPPATPRAATCIGTAPRRAPRCSPAEIPFT